MTEHPTSHCLNCGTPLEGAYCHTCGQRARNPVGPIREWLEETLDALFSLDNRLWRTAKALAVPGLLTTEYVAGRRVPYVSPLRLYLFVSVGYFLLAQVLGRTDLMFVTASEGSNLAEILPRIMFFIVPAGAWLLHGLYRRQQRVYVEHLAFALHVHSAWYLLFAVSLLVSPADASPEALPNAGPLTLLLVALGVASRLSVFVYTFMALRRVYGQGRLKTVLKSALFFLGYMVLLGAAVFTWMGLVNAMSPPAGAVP